MFFGVPMGGLICRSIYRSTHNICFADGRHQLQLPGQWAVAPEWSDTPSDIFGAKSESGGRLKAVPLKIDQANISTGPRQCSWGHFQAWWKPMGLATKSRNYRQVRLIGLELTDTSYFRLFSTAAFPSCGLSNHHNHLQINYLAAALTTLFRRTAPIRIRYDSLDVAPTWGANTLQPIRYCTVSPSA